MYRTGSISSGSNVLSSLARTSDLYVGEFVYAGDVLPPGTYIQSITDSNNVVLSGNAEDDFSGMIEFTSANPGVYEERLSAMLDAKNQIEERGEIVEFIIRNESGVTRDIYGSIQKRAESARYIFRAFPVDFAPSDKQLEKAGIREKMDVLIYCNALDFILAGIDIDAIDLIRVTIKIRGNTYQLKEKSNYGQFADSYIYSTFGCSKS